MNEIVRDFTEDTLLPQLPDVASGDALKAYTLQDDMKNPIGVLPILKDIENRINAWKEQGHTVETKEGRDAIRSFAHLLTKVKSKIEAVGKELADEQKAIPKRIDTARSYLKTALEAMRDEVREPLTIWEEAEEARIAKHQQALAAIAEAQDVEDMTAADIAGKIAAIEAIELTKENCDEFIGEYAIAKEETLTALRKAHEKQVAADANAAELARLRAIVEEQQKEAERERLRKEGEERAKLEAEADAKAERDRVAKERELEAFKLEQERIQREAVERENERLKAEAIEKAAAAAAAERKRIEDEQAAKEEEQRKREANARHVSHVRRAAKEALMHHCGLDEETAKKVVIAINAEKIPNISISY